MLLVETKGKAKASPEPMYSQHQGVHDGNHIDSIRRVNRFSPSQRRVHNHMIVFSFGYTAARIMTIVAVMSLVFLGTAVGTHWSRGAGMAR